jgi:hypothetical protein
MEFSKLFAKKVIVKIMNGIAQCYFNIHLSNTFFLSPSVTFLTNAQTNPSQVI